MTKPISPLRQRMLDHMAFRNMSPATQKCYTYAVACFARYHRTPPDKLGIEHVRDYRLLKDKAAQSLGQRGGKARAAALTRKRRAEIAKKAALSRWSSKHE